MKTGKERRIRIIKLVLLMTVLLASHTINFETGATLQTVNATVSSSAPFQYIVTILMENNGLCDVTPSLVSGCGSSSIPSPYLTTLAQTYGFNTHYTGISHPSEPNYVALFGGSTLGISSDGNCCFQLNAPNLVDRLEAAGLTWKAFAEDASGSGTCSFMPPREGDHYPFIDFSDMKTSARCANMLTTTSPLDPEFVGALNGATLPNYVWLTPNDTDNMHSSSVGVGDAYLATLVPLILSSRMFTTQKAALFIVFDEGSDVCPTGNSSSDCVVAEWAGPAVKKAYTSTTSYDHYSYLSTLEASWNLPSLTSNDASATPMTEFFGTSPPPALSASFAYSPSSTQAGQPITFTASARGGTSPFTFSWSFGDGSTGTGSSVTHTYSSAGSFTTALTVKDSSSPQQTATSQMTVAVTSPPPPISASFTLSPSSPSAGQPVSFTASASGGTPPYSYTWSYGDGSTGTGLQVTHTYDRDGTYQVTLTVADSTVSTGTWVAPVVVGTASLQDGFTYSPTSPQPGDNINFTPSARGGTPPYSYSWDFGNGASASGASATYSYASAGSYTVTLTVIDSMNRSNNTSQSLTIYSPAHPDFTLNTDQSTLNAQPGSEQLLAITVTDSTSRSGTIMFNATISPSGPQISLTPANVSLSAEGSGTTSLDIDFAPNTTPGPYWIQVSATNGSITHSITVQVDVAQLSQPPTSRQPCQFCLVSAAIIAILGVAGTVTLVTQMRRSRRLAAVRIDTANEDDPNRASQCLGRPLQ